MKVQAKMTVKTRNSKGLLDIELINMSSTETSPPTIPPLASTTFHELT